MYFSQYAVMCLYLLTYFLKSECNRFLNYVKSCPDSRESWILKSKYTSCESGLFYHCIRERTGDLVEACLNVYDLPSKDGCPFIQVAEGEIIPGFHQEQCIDEDGRCPPENGTFSSNLLFKYPVCISSEIIYSSAKMLTSSPAAYSSSKYEVEVTSIIYQTDTIEIGRYVDSQKSWWSYIIDFFGDIRLVGGLIFIMFIAVFITVLIIVIRRNRMYRLQLQQARYVSPIQLEDPTLHTYDEVNNENIDRKSSDNSDGSSYLEPIKSSNEAQQLKSGRSDSVIDMTNVDTATELKQYHH